MEPNCRAGSWPWRLRRPGSGQGRRGADLRSGAQSGTRFAEDGAPVVLDADDAPALCGGLFQGFLGARRVLELALGVVVEHEQQRDQRGPRPAYGQSWAGPRAGRSEASPRGMRSPTIVSIGGSAARAAFSSGDRSRDTSVISINGPPVSPSNRRRASTAPCRCRCGCGVARRRFDSCRGHPPCLLAHDPIGLGPSGLGWSCGCSWASPAALGRRSACVRYGRGRSSRRSGRGRCPTLSGRR